MPDILLFESSSATFDPTYPSNIVVGKNGDCNFVPPGIFKSTCSIDMTWDGAAPSSPLPPPTATCHVCPVSWNNKKEGPLGIVILHIDFLLPRGSRSRNLGHIYFTRPCTTEFPNPSCREVFGFFLGSYPGLWATTAASYCPSRAGELPKNNLTNPSA